MEIRDAPDRHAKNKNKEEKKLHAHTFHAHSYLKQIKQTNKDIE